MPWHALVQRQRAWPVADPLFQSSILEELGKYAGDSESQFANLIKENI
jgi:hypothetical protein